MKVTIEIGRFNGNAPKSVPERMAFAESLVPDISESRRVACNFIRPGSVVEAAHIADVPPPPPYDYIAVIEAAPRSDQPKSASNVSGVERLSAERRETSRSDLARGLDSDDDLALRQLCFIKRREGMSIDDFVGYYENVHAPLACKHLPQIARYNRYFVLSEPHSGEKAFDVITEICFRTLEDRDAFAATLADPKIGEIFAVDEAQLFDRSSISMVIVDCVEAHG